MITQKSSRFYLVCVLMFNCYLGFAQSGTSQGSQSNCKDKLTLKVVATASCSVTIDGDELGKMSAGQAKKLCLPEGNYHIKAKPVANDLAVFSSEYTVSNSDLNTSGTMEIKFTPKPSKEETINWIVSKLQAYVTNGTYSEVIGTTKPVPYSETFYYYLTNYKINFADNILSIQYHLRAPLGGGFEDITRENNYELNWDDIRSFSITHDPEGVNECKSSDTWLVLSTAPNKKVKATWDNRQPFYMQMVYMPLSIDGESDLQNRLSNAFTALIEYNKPAARVKKETY